jgi:transglutaminase-like putative cysteine protease
VQRTVSSRLVFSTSANTAVVLAIAVARNPGLQFLQERLEVTSGGRSVPVQELADSHGGRLHSLHLDEASHVVVEYSATVKGVATPEVPAPVDLIRYVRPSRYCESDKLLPTSYAEFSGLSGLELLQAVRNWVNSELAYIGGASRATDGAVETLLARAGVCRDFAHLVLSLLRAKDIPARLAAVYAPGLSPMDFHAVAEAWVDGQWYVLDATGLAPRSSLLRIATGRDASDTAFLSTVGGSLTLNELTVMATVDGNLPTEDPQAAVVMA